MMKLQNKFKYDRTLELRVINCLRHGNFYYESFINLLGVWTGPVGSAAIVVAPSTPPKLVIDKDFLNDFVVKEEHLYLLVYHELLHVILAHTRIASRITPIQNIAFDALINAIISRQHYQPQFEGFFDKLNKADRFPHCLLRPPVGWPNKPLYPTDIGPNGTANLIQQMYPALKKIDETPLPLYSEILSLLEKEEAKNQGAGRQRDLKIKQNNQTHKQDGRGREQKRLQGDGERQVFEDEHGIMTEDNQMSSNQTQSENDKQQLNNPSPFLIGSHHTDTSSQLDSNPLMKEFMKSFSSSQQEFLNEQDVFDLLIKTNSVKPLSYKIDSPHLKAKKLFHKILKWSIKTKASTQNKRDIEKISCPIGNNFIVNVHDRSYYTYKKLGIPKLLFKQDESLLLPTYALRQSLVYLDVSGSMSQVTGQLIGLMLPFLKRNELKLYTFSTSVTGPYSCTDCQNKTLITRGGTNIDCVLNHISTITPSPQKVIIVTDGQFRTPSHLLMQKVHKKKMSICTVLFGENCSEQNVQAFSKKVITMPALI